MSSLYGSPIMQLNHPRPSPSYSPRSWSNNNFLRRTLPISLLWFFSLSTLPVASIQKELLLDNYDLPPPQQCGSFTLAWSGGVPPYTLLILNATDLTTLRAPVNGTEDTTVTWSPVDFPGGVKLFAEVKDSDYGIAAMGVLIIQNGANSHCLPLVTEVRSPSSTMDSTLSAHVASTSTTSSISTPPSSISTSSSPSSYPTSTGGPTFSSSQKASGGLSTGAIAGIAVGLAVLFLLVAVACVHLRRWRAEGQRKSTRLFHKAESCGDLSVSSNSTGPSPRLAVQPSTFWDATDTPVPDMAFIESRDYEISNASSYPSSSYEDSTSEVQAPHSGSVLAHTCSISSRPPTRISPPHWRSNEGPFQPEKLLRELSSRSALVSGPGGVHDQVNDPSSNQWMERRRYSRHKTDGGVRLAGGRAGEAIADDIDQNSVSDGSTLPPPYSSHFGES